jgi:hypothetical protein
VRALLVLGVLLAGQPLVLEHLALPAPDGWTLEHRRGPDFSVFFVSPPPESGAGSLGVYLGNHPSVGAPKEAVRSEPFPFGRKQVRWSTWREDQKDGTQLHRAELLVEKPFGIEPRYSTHLHIFLTASSSEHLDKLKSLAVRMVPHHGAK